MIHLKAKIIVSKKCDGEKRPNLKRGEVKSIAERQTRNEILIESPNQKISKGEIKLSNAKFASASYCVLAIPTVRLPHANDKSTVKGPTAIL